MAQVAPYQPGMRLGQGYNSYTQEVRLDDAVTITPVSRDAPVSSAAAQAQAQPIAQTQPRAPTAPIDGSAKAAQDLPTAAAPVPGSAVGSTTSSTAPSSNITLTPKVKAVATLPAIEDVKKGTNVSLAKSTNDTLLAQVSSEYTGPRYVLPPVKQGQQLGSDLSVTFSTRAISNMSDIMDALNISASTSIKYGTVHGNGSASFVNEDKVLDSELNYLISVRVNNNEVVEADSMTFKSIPNISPDKFTEIYGDCFVAGFQTGGEFNAVISVDCHDKSKALAVKELIDLELAIPPVPGLQVGVEQGFGKSHSELLRGIEFTISVNWTGGGELKPPDVPWDLKTVVAAANAYPSMIARSASRVSAILRPYTSLSSFVTWQYTQQTAWEEKITAFDTKFPAPTEKQKEQKQLLIDQQALWTDKTLILNYAPCQLYTNDLFNAYVQFKWLWKRISFIMSDTKKWRARKREDIVKTHGFDTFEIKEGIIPSVPTRQNSRPQVTIPDTIKENAMSNGLSATSTPGSSTKTKDFASPATQPQTPHVGSLSRFDTFPLQDPSIEPEFPLDKLNKSRDPIPLDPVELNEARLLCREAMTLITEEAYSLVYHPDLAYAEYNKTTKMTKMKRPIYMYPEVLKARLPTFIRNDAATSRRSRDPVIVKLKQFDNNDLWASLVGDEPHSKWTYRPFVSLERNESNENASYVNPLIGLSIHAYAHSKRYHVLPQWFSDSHRAIGGFGFRFEDDKWQPGSDGCTQWEGEFQSHDNRMIKTLMLRNRIESMKEEKKEKPKDDHHHWLPGSSSRALKPDTKSEPEPPKTNLHTAASEDRDIRKIEVFYVPGSGRISGLVFHDAYGPTNLAWKQWEGERPSNMHPEEHFPPRDGTKWKFVGLMGDWATDALGNNKVLSRVSGIWRKA